MAFFAEGVLDFLNRAEKEHVLPPHGFHVAVISGFRADSDAGKKDCLRVQRSLTICGISPVWYVDAQSLASYRALGLDAKVGGKLFEARNMALDDAAALQKPCVQVSDDLTNMRYYIENLGKQNSILCLCARIARKENRCRYILLVKLINLFFSTQMGSTHTIGSMILCWSYSLVGGPSWQPDNWESPSEERPKANDS